MVWPKKQDITVSVSLITSEDFNTGNNVTPENLLTGRVAGLNINTNGGPAGNSEIRIRGGASLNASNNPLIVIDGLPVNDPNDTDNGSRSILSSINPNDIESFSVLKDAAAAAIYGNRGANGVIIITTKKGKGTFTVNLNSQTSITTVDKKVDVFSSDEYRALIADRLDNRVNFLGNANTDWQDAIYRDAFSSQHDVSLTGTLFKKLPVRYALSRTDQEGLRRTSNFERTTNSLSLNPEFIDGHLKIDLNANLNFERNRFAANVEKDAITFDPTQPIFDANSPYGGFFEYLNESGFALANVQRNPVAQLLQTRNIASVRRYFGNLKFDYKFHFLPELRAVVNLGMDVSETDRFEERPNNSALGFQAPLGLFVGNKTDIDFLSENRLLDTYLSYSKGFGDLDLDGTLGYSYQKFEVEKFTTQDQRNPRLIPEKTIDPDVLLLAYFARVNFKYKDKYTLNSSIRRDGASRFSKDDRWGYFPAVSLGWQISNESFLKSSNTINNLKLRVGYGVTGQQDITEAYAYLERYRGSSPNTQYIFNGEVINIVQPEFRNPDIKWERIFEYNAGIDIGLFDNQFTSSIDFFRKESKDLLSQAPIPDGVNFSNQGFQNIGEFVTQGIEFSVNSDIINNNRVQWNLNYNLTYINQEIKELAFGQDILSGGIDGGTGNNILIQRQGEAPNSFFTFAQLYDINGLPIEGAYADLNGDGVINLSDRYPTGNAVPDLTMGLQSYFSYDNLDLSFNIRASLGNDIYNNVASANAQNGNLFRNVLNNSPTSLLDSNFNNTPDVILSDFYVEDASFVRMDNVTLGYTFKNLMKGISKLRIWTSVQNVFTITDYSGLDPEIQNNGIDQSIFPRGRTFLLGLNYTY